MSLPRFKKESLLPFLPFHLSSKVEGQGLHHQLFTSILVILCIPTVSFRIRGYLVGWSQVETLTNWMKIIKASIYATNKNMHPSVQFYFWFAERKPIQGQPTGRLMHCGPILFFVFFVFFCFFLFFFCFFFVFFLFFYFFMHHKLLTNYLIYTITKKFLMLYKQR